MRVTPLLASAQVKIKLPGRTWPWCGQSMITGGVAAG
jgi:hypothetical protein